MSCSTCRRILLFWPVLSILAGCLAVVLWRRAFRYPEIEPNDYPELLPW